MKGYKNISLPKQQMHCCNKAYRQNDRLWQKSQMKKAREAKALSCCGTAGKPEFDTISKQKRNCL